ncbi:TetR/AcrR family transcriptional regulator [Caulobacter sp. LARHSG274]
MPKRPTALADSSDKKARAAVTPAPEVAADDGAMLRRGGRPTLEQAREIEQAILAAARDQFLTLGVEAAALEVIAANAKVSKSTIYSRYGTKEALLRAVVEDRIKAWGVAGAARRGPMPDDFKDRLRYLARSVVEDLGSEELRAFQRVISTSTAAGGEIARTLHEVGHKLAINAFSEEIRLGTRDHLVPPRSPTRVAEMLMASLAGWYDAHSRVRDIPAEEAHTYADHVVDVLFAGRSAW